MSAPTTAASLAPPDFVAWPKTPRLYRDMVITEKIDGTNGAIIVTDDGDVWAQSRNRLLYPPCDEYPNGTDNAGFRVWVDQHRATLSAYLGTGRHFGEWWGTGIQRGYDRPGKTFSLFNVAKWNRREALGLDIDLDVVPTIYEGTFDTQMVQYQLDELCVLGSAAAPGFMRPEGVCVFHVASGRVFKALIENDDIAKNEAVDLGAARRAERIDIVKLTRVTTPNAFDHHLARSA